MPHNQTDTLRVSTLVSIGAHPDTGRARRSATDARAVELAMNLEGCELEVLHAGNPQDPALSYYSGMGLSQIRVLAQDEQDDAVNTLSSYFRDDMPDIVLDRNACGKWRIFRHATFLSCSRVGLSDCYGRRGNSIRRKWYSASITSATKGTASSAKRISAIYR
ncbi:hypothetical protein P4S64_20480 [Vibrio sp. M60_M31a]